MDRRRKNTVKERSLHRIKIIQGHLKSIETMIEENKYCVDIIHQSQAVQSALSKLDQLIMKDHLSTCVVNQIKNGDEKKSTEEIIKLFEFKNK